MKGFAQKLGVELIESKMPLASDSLAGVRLLAEPLPLNVRSPWFTCVPPL